MRMLLCEVAITLGGLRAFMTEHLTYLQQRGAVCSKERCTAMTKIMPMEVSDAGTLQRRDELAPQLDWIIARYP